MSLLVLAMDEMKIKLGGNFMRKIVSKLLMKMLKDKLGYNMNIDIKDLDIQVLDGNTKVAASVEVDFDSHEFKKILKGAGLD